jgi:transcriptional regulator with XRE-family HTH domain
MELSQYDVISMNDPSDQHRNSNSAELAHTIATRIQSLRAQQALTLEDLAAKSGVSRSMISSVERGQTNPTALVLDRLASALGVALTQLLEAVTAKPEPLARAAQQSLWQDPDSGYVRRSLSPAGSSSRLRLVEVGFPAGARIAYEPNAAQPPIHQQIWLLEGQVQITLGSQTYTLAQGDCLAMTIDQPIVFFNASKLVARYLVAQA